MMNSVVLIRDGPRRRAEASEDSWKERRTEKMWYPLPASSRRAAPSLSARRATSRISPAVVPTRQRNSLIETCPSTDPRPLILFLPKFTRIHPGVIIAQTTPPYGEGLVAIWGINGQDRAPYDRSPAPMNGKKTEDDTQSVAVNRKARHDYHLTDHFEAGLVLRGTEVKSARAGRVNLKDSYATERGGELYLMQCHISPYTHAFYENHDPLRPRKLLVHRQELRRLIGKISQRGLTIISTRIYFPP